MHIEIQSLSTKIYIIYLLYKCIGSFNFPVTGFTDIILGLLYGSKEAFEHYTVAQNLFHFIQSCFFCNSDSKGSQPEFSWLMLLSSFVFCGLALLFKEQGITVLVGHMTQTYWLVLIVCYPSRRLMTSDQWSELALISSNSF